MTIDDPLQRARRSYIWQSIVAMVILVAIAIVATWKIAQAPQLGIWQILIPAAFWLFVLYVAWTLRQYYVRLDANTLDRYRLK
jgi:hypothetical protein